MDSVNYRCKFGRKMRIVCKGKCKNYHVSVLNVSSALRIFELFRGVKRFSKSQKALYIDLELRRRLAIQRNRQVVNISYSNFIAVNEALEKMRHQFVIIGRLEYAAEARLALVVDHYVFNCV